MTGKLRNILQKQKDHVVFTSTYSWMLATTPFND